MKLLREIFEPLCPEKFTEFLDVIRQDYDELTDWEDLPEREQIGLKLQFSILTGIRISDITDSINDNR